MGGRRNAEARLFEGGKRRWADKAEMSEASFLFVEGTDRGTEGEEGEKIYRGDEMVREEGREEGRERRT